MSPRGERPWLTRTDRGRPWHRYLRQRPVRPPRGLGVSVFDSVKRIGRKLCFPLAATKRATSNAGLVRSLCWDRFKMSIPVGAKGRPRAPALVSVDPGASLSRRWLETWRRGIICGMAEPTPKRRWFQFSLSSLLWLTFATALVLNSIRSHRQQVLLQARVSELEEELAVQANGSDRYIKMLKGKLLNAQRGLPGTKAGLSQ
jgi:hypothetical protein